MKIDDNMYQQGSLLLSTTLHEVKQVILIVQNYNRTGSYKSGTHSDDSALHT